MRVRKGHKSARQLNGLAGSSPKASNAFRRSWSNPRCKEQGLNCTSSPPSGVVPVDDRRLWKQSILATESDETLPLVERLLPVLHGSL